MSVFDLREWLERSIPAWTLAIPCVILVFVAVIQKFRK